MKINISNLSQGTHEYELSKDPVEVGLPENFSANVVAKVTLEKSSRQILVSARVAARGMFQCDRCLDEYSNTIESKLRTLYVWDADGRANGDSEDVRLLAHDANVIDLSNDVRDLVLLSVPLKLLCKEECAGLCPHCGRNLNQMANGECDCAPRDSDPRWNKLAVFFDETLLKKKN